MNSCEQAEYVDVCLPFPLFAEVILLRYPFKGLPDTELYVGQVFLIPGLYIRRRLHLKLRAIRRV